MTAALSGEQLMAGVAVRPLRQADAPAMHALLAASRTLSASAKRDDPDKKKIAGWEETLTKHASR